MIKQNYALNACKGMWPIPAVRPLSGWYFDLLASYGLWMYPGGSEGSFSAKSNMNVSPIYTKHWLIRNGMLPLSGGTETTPYPPGNIIGFELQSNNGWAVGNKSIKVPRTLIICLNYRAYMTFDSTVPNGGFSFSDDTWFGSIFKQRRQELNGIGIDVYMCQTDGRMGFLCPAESYATTVYYGSYTQPGSPTPLYGFAINYRNFIDLNDVSGGEVMIVNLGYDYSGYLGYYGLWGSNSSSDVPSDYEYVNSTYTNPYHPPDPYYPEFSVYFSSTKQSVEEATALLRISQNCSKFAFDVYASSNAASIFTFDYSPPYPYVMPVETVFQADARFRNGVPGNCYYYGLQGDVGTLPGVGQTNAELAANQIIDRALTFFS